MSTELLACQNTITRINPDTPVDQIADVLSQLDGMTQRIKELRADLEARMIEKITETGQDIVIGTVRYYVGLPKTTRCKDGLLTLTRILEASGGDMGKVVECLASSAFKHGTIKRLLAEAGVPEQYDECFAVTESAALLEGKPRLQKID